MKQDKAAPAIESLGVVIPDSQLAREVAQLIRDTESELLFNHSTRVYLWGALLGERKRVAFDRKRSFKGAPCGRRRYPLDG
ncbi:hypothetical protein EPAKOI_005113 (plasmid) [Cupriavidus sp. H18C2]